MKVLICGGVGGVGKTTTAAAVALAHARSGARTVVLTIDPARRLADALGLVHLGNAPTPIDLSGIDILPGGSLDALMLDRKATWDEVVRGHAPSAEMAEGLLDNRYYRALSTRLTGGHEYMATEKLHQLVELGRWDVIVVDTPPSQHAVDFFEAPDRIRRILDRKLLGPLLAPGEGLVGVATRGVSSFIRRLAGETVIDDLREFFDLVAGLSLGFRERSEVVSALMRSDATGYLLVADARAPRVGGLMRFLGLLSDNGMQFRGFLLNRVEPGLSAPVADMRAAVTHTGLASPATESLLELAQRRADRAEDHAELIRTLAGSGRVWPLPDVAGGIHDLAGLDLLASRCPPLV